MSSGRPRDAAGKRLFNVHELFRPGVRRRRNMFEFQAVCQCEVAAMLC